MSLSTKRALAASFRKLLSKRSLDKITVKDIVNDCGVNRQTFYYHFHDVYDLMEWMFQDEADSLMGKQRDYGDWTAGLEMLMKFLRENRELVRNAYHSISHKVVANYIKQILGPYVLQIVQIQTEGMEPPASRENLEFVSEILTLAVLGLITEWIDSGESQMTEERLRKFQAAISGSVPFMLRNLREYENN